MLLVAYLAFSSSGDDRPERWRSLSLRDGDLVFRRGRSLESYAVILAEKNKGYSHIGIVVLEAGNPFVIHVEPGETSLGANLVKKEPLGSFLQQGKASHYAIYRSRLDRECLDRVKAEAESFYRRKCRFDDAYDLATDRDLYCTELVFKAYRRGDAAIDGLLGKLEKISIMVTCRRILMPGAFISSDLFYKVYSG